MCLCKHNVNGYRINNQSWLCWLSHCSLPMCWKSVFFDIDFHHPFWCVYLSKSVPLTFPVTQVAILTHLWHILPHKGSIKRSQLSLWQEPIQFQSASDFTIYLCCLRYLLLSCQDHNSITFLVVVEVTCASLTSRHIFLGKFRCELSSGDSLSLHQAFSAACGSSLLYPPLLQVKHGQKFC